jgi:hypothetical protein
MPRYKDVWPLVELKFSGLNGYVRIEELAREPGGGLRPIGWTFTRDEFEKLLAAGAKAFAQSSEQPKEDLEFKDHPKLGDSIPGDPAATIEHILRL